MELKENSNQNAKVSKLSVVEQNGVTSSSTKQRPKEKEQRLPRWRRCCLRNMLPFTLWFSVVNLATSALTPYLTSQITTIEKRFGLSSSQSGLLRSMNDAGFVIVVLFISHFGRNSHIPRILAACGLLYGFAALLCIVPHLTRVASNGAPEVTTNTSANFTSRKEDLLCSDVIRNPEDAKCSAEERDFYSSGKSLAVLLISTGMFIQGIAKSPRQPLSQTYVDDNVPPTKSGFHIGIMTCIGVFGPAVSFGLGGFVSNIYVTLEETDMTPRDPRWVGAWWIGFLIFGALSIVSSFPLFLFPKSLINAPTNRTDITEVTKDGETRKRIVAVVKDVLRSMLRLLKNGVFMCLVTGVGLKIFAVSGILAFTPKFVQIHYGLTISKSNIIMGFVAILAAACGIFLSGLITRRWKFGLKGMVGVVLVTQIISGCFSFIPIFFKCPQPEILGFAPVSAQSEQSVLLTADTFPSCYADCNCNGADYFPVCGSNGLNYFSPCHAGCESRTAQGYGNCSCVTNTTVDEPTFTVDATPGLCHSECSFYIYFVVMTFLAAFSTGLGGVPITLAVMRSVDEEDKALGLGVNSFISSLFGWFLGPLVIGFLIDSTCLMWETSCSKEGSCAVYDIVDLRYKINGVDAGIGVVYITLYFIAYIFAGRREKGKLHITKSAPVPNEAEKGMQETKS